jgi:hypothetical protein
MKIKLLLSSLICTLLLFGCKKDKPADPLAVAKKQIIGLWDLTESKTVGYDAGGSPPTVEYADTRNPITFEFLDESHVKLTSVSYIETSIYSIKRDNGKLTILFHDDDYELAINGKAMTWVQERNYDRPGYSKFISTNTLIKR